MKDCVSPEGHLWTDRFPRPESMAGYEFMVSGGGKYPTATFHGVTSTFVRCSREGCDETGYRILETSGSNGEPA